MGRIKISDQKPSDRERNSNEQRIIGGRKKDKHRFSFRDEKDTKTFIRKFLEANQEDFANAYKELDPASRCDVYCKLVRYVVPVARTEEEEKANTALGEAIKRLAGDS